MSTSQRILCISLSAIGDTLMCLPALEAVDRTFPAAKIGFLVPEQYRSLYTEHPSLDVVLSGTLPSGKTWEGLARLRHLMAIMRAFAPDVAFIFVGTPRYVEMVLRLMGVRRIYRVPNHHGVPKLLTNSALTAENDWDISKHGVEDRLRAVRLYGVQAEESPMRLPVQEAWVLTARGWLKSHGYAESRLVLLQVGASSARRRWPIDRFANLARRLVAEFHDLRCVVTGSPEERDYCCRVVELARDARVCTSAGELSLGGLAGIMSHCLLC